jgi:hypothetical protein
VYMPQYPHPFIYWWVLGYSTTSLLWLLQ